jgi:hypothetical protein
MQRVAGGMVATFAVSAIEAWNVVRDKDAITYFIILNFTTNFT